MRKLKLVFFLADADTNEVIGMKKQINIEIDDVTEREVVSCTGVVNFLPACLPGRTPRLRDMLQAYGIMMSRALMPVVRKLLGAPEDALDVPGVPEKKS